MIKIKNFKQFNESVDVDVCIDYVIGDDKLVFKSINTKDMDDKELDFLKNNDFQDEYILRYFVICVAYNHIFRHIVNYTQNILIS